MDLISHFLWSYVLFGQIVHLQNVSLWAVLFFSVFPDLSLIPFIWFELTHFRKYDIQKIHKLIPHYAEIGYHISHSFVTVLVVSFLFLIIAPTMVLPVAIGWGMHILIDLFIHKKGMQVMPLYPVSKRSVKGVVTWYKSTWFMVLDVILLVIIFTYLFIAGKFI